MKRTSRPTATTRLSLESPTCRRTVSPFPYFLGQALTVSTSTYRKAAPTRFPSLRSENSFRRATARSCPSLCRCITAYATAFIPADSSTNCRRFSTTSNEPWRFGLISERSDLFEFVCHFVPGRGLYGRRPRPAPILRAKRRVQGPRPDPGRLRPFSGMPGRRRRRVTRRADSPQICHAHAFVDGEARQSARSSPLAVVESFEGERILVEAVEILREVPGERVLGRAFPQPLPRRRGHRVPRRSPNRPRLPPAMRTDAKTVRDDANQRPERCRKLAPLTAPRLWEKCASFTGIKHTFHCAAIKSERSAMFFPRKTSETWYKHLFQNYRFAYFGAFVSHLY